jgi:hypothetical protein
MTVQLQQQQQQQQEQSMPGVVCMLQYLSF